MKDPAPEVISFDAAGTLIHLAEPVGQSYARVARNHGFSLDPDHLGRTFGSVWKETAPAFSPDGPFEIDERSWWSRLVREVFGRAGAFFPDEARYADFFDDLYRHFEAPGTWIPEAEIRPLLTQVAQRYRCVVLSNFDSRLRRILGDLDLLSPFETLFLSCEQRLSKPDPLLFARVSESLSVAPSSILHIGDDPVCDWAAAESAGFRHLRVGPGQKGLAELLEELLLA